MFEALAEAGLPVDEVRLYVAALAAGPGPITRLASELEISRPFAHKLAASLERRGLGQFAFRRKYAGAFAASSPEVVLDLLRKRRERAQRMHSELLASLPDMLSLHKGRATRREGVRLLAGTWDTIKRLRKEILDEADASGVAFYGSVVDWTSFLENLDPMHKRRWIAERVRRGIRSRALVFDAPFSADHAKALREVRIIRNVLPAPIVLQLYGKKAVIWLLKDAVALQINDSDIVRVLRNLFDVSWLQSEPFRHGAA